MNRSGIFLLVILAAFAVSCTNPSGNVTSTNRVVIRIIADSTIVPYTVLVSANAYVYDENNQLITGAEISVDGVDLEETEINTYYKSVADTWAAGSTHTYSVSTSDGGSATGSITKPSGTLTGVTYSPGNADALAQSYTVSPPAGGWPTGSYIACYIKTENGSNYAIVNEPTGTNTVTIDSSLLVNAQSVRFAAALINKASIPGYDPDSVISVSGDSTPW